MLVVRDSVQQHLWPKLISPQKAPFLICFIKNSYHLTLSHSTSKPQTQVSVLFFLSSFPFHSKTEQKSGNKEGTNERSPFFSLTFFLAISPLKKTHIRSGKSCLTHIKRGGSRISIGAGKENTHTQTHNKIIGAGRRRRINKISHRAAQLYPPSLRGEKKRRAMALLFLFSPFSQSIHYYSLHF